jgi:hypothetical protein
MAWRKRLTVAVVAVALLVAACGSPARDEAHQTLVDQLVDGGLDRATAACVVDAFFAGKSNDDLRGFFERKELTAAESKEFAELGKKCLTGT